MHSPELQRIIAAEKQQRLLRDAELKRLINEARKQRSSYIMTKLNGFIRRLSTKKEGRKAKPHPVRKPM